MATLWKTHCSHCKGLHLDSAACPGSLPAAGEERVAWRALADTEDGVVAFGILLDRTPCGWRSRIQTFPKTIWMLPGERETLKFFAVEAEHALGLAMEFLRLHCRQSARALRNVQFLEEFLPERLGNFRISPPRHPHQELRKPGFFDIRFGRHKPSLSGTTRDLSAHGLFVFTANPQDEGQVLRLRLEVGGNQFPLDGRVRWFRPDCLPGMGLQLEAPSMEYRQIVAALPSSLS
ncbi:MAG: PilZ domain-containing protein [Planctomycetota bacterium]|nr:PilZ domain-containing protein [Planctomycetota bacterium]